VLNLSKLFYIHPIKNYAMKIASILAGVSLLVQLYNDNYKQADLDKTLKELENDLSLPRIRTYDFIVGKSLEKNSISIVIK
jgi:hypothetical protein